MLPCQRQSGCKRRDEGSLQASKERASMKSFGATVDGVVGRNREPVQTGRAHHKQEQRTFARSREDEGGLQRVQLDSGSISDLMVAF